MKLKTDKRKTNKATITIDPCLCGSAEGVVQLEHEDGLRIPITRCAGCGMEVDHTIYSGRMPS
jgi:hypothetical protein